VLAGRLPTGWDADLPIFDADPKGMATRKASGQVLNALAKTLVNLVGGSADLAGSNLSWQKGKGSFREPGVPNNVNFGVREHGMGAVLNGMALHGGVIPYGATFLIFSDYMRPSIRLAALSSLETRYIFTHDSIGLGEDGPTHQPIEHLAALRAIPGLLVLRPADANETREAWKAALMAKGPAALVLTRQNLPTVDRSTMASADGLHRGAYVLRDTAGGEPQAIIMASGSEVGIAVAAQDMLSEDGIRVRVVSVPSVELFAAQDASYRDQVLPPTLAPRVVVEAGIRQGWDRWAGPRAAFVTIERFGASAPYDVIYEEFGLTPANVAAQVKKLLG
jgi:transketolase